MATCAECVHVEVCKDFISSLLEGLELDKSDVELINKELNQDDADKGACDHFWDRARVAALPCMVGDTVYVIESIAGEEKIIQDHVETMGIGYYADGINIYQWDGVKTEGYFEDFGKTVFLTREEAERALKEREKDESKGAGVSVGSGEACDRGRAAE